MNKLDSKTMSPKILLSLALIIALAIFAGCSAVSGVMNHGPVPSDLPAYRLLPAALAENNWRTTATNDLPPEEAAIGDYGNFRMFAVKYSSPSAAYELMANTIAAAEECRDCSRESALADERGYLKYSGPDLPFTLGGAILSRPFLIWNNGQWIFAVENTGAEDFRDSVAEVFPY